MIHYLSIIIPVYNEENKIIRDLEKTVDFISQQSFFSEIIIVNDGSQDLTLDLVIEYKKNSKHNIKIISYTKNRGKGYAVKQGMLKASGQYLLFVDAGYCVPFENVFNGLELLKSGYDIALGSREHQNARVVKRQPLYRRIGSKIFFFIVQLFVFINVNPIKDTQCGFKLFKNNVGKKVFSENVIDGFMFDIETILRAKDYGYKIAEFPVQWRNDPDTRFNPISGSIRNFKELFIIKKNQYTRKFRLIK